MTGTTENGAIAENAGNRAARAAGSSPLMKLRRDQRPLPGPDAAAIDGEVPAAAALHGYIATPLIARGFPGIDGG